MSDENQKLSKELISILGENLIQGVDTKNQVESIDKNVAAASQNIAVNNKNLMLADEKINKLAETMKSLQAQHFASSATLEALKEVKDFPAKCCGKLKAIAGCVSVKTIEERIYKVNIAAPAFCPSRIIRNKIR